MHHPTLFAKRAENKALWTGSQHLTIVNYELWLNNSAAQWCIELASRQASLHVSVGNLAVFPRILACFFVDLRFFSRLLDCLFLGLFWLKFACIWACFLHISVLRIVFFTKFHGHFALSTYCKTKFGRVVVQICSFWVCFLDSPPCFCI